MDIRSIPALLAAGLLAATAPAPAVPKPAVRTPAVQPELPRPTGSRAVGRDTLYLVDKSRRDPWVATAAARELMVSMYYPAKKGTGTAAPYMTVEEAKLLLQLKAPQANIPAEVVKNVRTYARQGARPAAGRFPLVVLSPGLTLPRATLTGLAEDLASRGYVVAQVEHPYESAGTSFPDGRTVACVICEKPPAGGPPAIARSRAKDVSFVIDELASWRNARMVDLKRIGMVGHSIGGNAAATTMVADRRVRAGVNMDGTFYAPVTPTKQAFLLLGTESEHSPGKDETWDRDWKSLHGWKRWLTVKNTDHASFEDLPVLQAQLGLPGASQAAAERAMEITRTYVGAFLDLQLKGRKQPVLDGPTKHDPEVVFQNPR
ncbi:alpha/beta hydrolase family protein [Nonomuraea sediminis]|uniref:alpha/beta hydrolase family protein n=1 Tax=Nonomuraea sediminis TaxID=2835864 RepID=UPI001BDCFD0F|nr:alpha/beta hydrolase [Nonomuraea sediminis]